MEGIEQILQELLDELLPTFYTAESRGAAILQFLKDKQLASEEELAPYLDQAANASSVRERAARLRLESLFSSVIKSIQTTSEASSRKALDDSREHKKEGSSDDGKPDKSGGGDKKDVSTRLVKSKPQLTNTSDQEPVEPGNKTDQNVHTAASSKGKPDEESKSKSGPHKAGLGKERDHDEERSSPDINPAKK